MAKRRTIIFNAERVLVGPTTETGSSPELLENGAIVVKDSCIEAVGPTGKITREYPPENASNAIDATNQTLLPGFVDSHTHGLFAGDRSDEFAAKLRGKSYQEILAEGGGILRTVQAVREADDNKLLGNLLTHLDVMLAHGTTTVEVKSGYGLDTETERQMLDVITRADGQHPIDIVPTFMGAHAVPRELEADTYVEEILDTQLPAIAEQGIAEFCDVFTEEDAFTVEQSRRILETGKEFGLTPKVHAEELSHLGGAQLAAEVGATSADHLLHAKSDDAKALAVAGVTPVLLPGTAFSLGADYADPLLFEEAGAQVAIASDFNPNCYSHSMEFAVSLACIGMDMAPVDAIIAATYGGAQALDCSKDLGTLREGAAADVLIIDAPSEVHVPYNFGVSTVATVIKDGEIVYNRDGSERI